MENDKTQQQKQNGGFLGESKDGEATGGLTMAPPSFSLAATPIQRKEVAQLADDGEFESSNTAAENIALIKAQWDSLGDNDNRKLAYILATVEGECGFHSREEKKQVKDDTDAQKDLIRRQNKYWNSGFYGRGFVQLTFESNYAAMSKVVGEDIVKNPRRALEPKNAAIISVYGMINGSFTGKKLSDYFNDKTTDYVGARRIINVQERAQAFADMAEAHFARLSGKDAGKSYYESFMNLYDIQEVLKAEGFLKGNVDGAGGSDTNQAIKAFKAKYNLPSPTSAKLDDVTKAKLLELQKLRIGSKVGKVEAFDPDKFWNDHGANAPDVSKAAIGILPSRSADVLALLKYLYWTSDNVSFNISTTLPTDKLKGLSRELLSYMHGCLDSGWTDGAEYEAMGKISLALDGKAEDDKASAKSGEKPIPKTVGKQTEKTKSHAATETAESVYKSVKGNYPELGALLAAKLTSNPQLVKDMFNYVSYFNTDDLAYYISLNASEQSLAIADKPLITVLYQSMDGDWTTTDEYKMMAKLKPHFTGEVDKEAGKENKGENVAGAGIEHFVISDAQAFIRDENLEKLSGNQTIPKWTEVIVSKTKSKGKDSYSFVTSPDGGIKWGWTATSNLYSITWSAKAHEKELKGVSSSYYDMMAANDPKVTRATTKLSGKDAVAQVNQYYPNQTDPKYLDNTFRAKMDVMLAGWKELGISAVANAGLRHPLRSVVFNYCLAIAAGGSEDTIHEANAVCTKYGIPVDWAHKKGDGTIDLAASKKGAQEMKAVFRLNKRAARGVTDFGGTVSNHNYGKAVDLSLSFTFSTATDVTVNGKTYTVTPSQETPSFISNVKNTPLSVMGREQYGLTRAMDDDTMHWSYNGK